MTVFYFPPKETAGEGNLASLLTPMQFKTLLLVICGLKNCEISEFLGTTEHVIRIVLADIYDCTGCANNSELILRYIDEVERGELSIGRLRRELNELQARAIHVPSLDGNLLHHFN